MYDRFRPVSNNTDPYNNSQFSASQQTIAKAMRQDEFARRFIDLKVLIMANFLAVALIVLGYSYLFRGDIQLALDADKAETRVVLRDYENLYSNQSIAQLNSTPDDSQVTAGSTPKGLSGVASTQTQSSAPTATVALIGTPQKTILDKPPQEDPQTAIIASALKDDKVTTPVGGAVAIAKDLDLPISGSGTGSGSGAGTGRSGDETVVGVGGSSGGTTPPVPTQPVVTPPPAAVAPPVTTPPPEEIIINEPSPIDDQGELDLIGSLL